MTELLEKDYEDWVCQNLAQVVGHDDATLVGRQLHLADGGCLDVLALHLGESPDNALQLTIIEVKREVIDEAAVGQILSYIGALRAMTKWLANSRDVVIEGVLVAPAVSLSAQYAISETPCLRYARVRDANDPSPHVKGRRASRAVSEKLNTLIATKTIRLMLNRVNRRTPVEV